MCKSTSQLSSKSLKQTLDTGSDGLIVILPLENSKNFTNLSYLNGYATGKSTGGSCKRQSGVQYIYAVSSIQLYMLMMKTNVYAYF